MLMDMVEFLKETTEIKEILRQQIKLLSEYSQKTDNMHEVQVCSEAMVALVEMHLKISKELR